MSTSSFNELVARIQDCDYKSVTLSLWIGEAGGLADKCVTFHYGKDILPARVPSVS